MRRGDWFGSRARLCLLFGGTLLASHSTLLCSAEEEPPLESFVTQPAAGAPQPVYRIGDSRDLWSRCRIDGFRYGSWARRYEISKDDGTSWQPLTAEASRGCRFDWLVRAAPGAETASAPGRELFGLSAAKPFDARASAGRLAEAELLDVGGKFLITPWLGVDAAAYLGAEAQGASLTFAARDLLGLKGLDLTATGGQGARSSTARFGDFGNRDITTHQEAWGTLLQYVPPKESPVSGLFRGAGMRLSESGTRNETETFTHTAESEDGLDVLSTAFRVAGGRLSRQEFAAITPFGMSLGLNDERLDYSGSPAIDSGLETLLGYHARELPNSTRLDLGVGYAEKTGDVIYDGTVTTGLLGGEVGARAASTALITQQQLFFSYGHCGLSIHHTEFVQGPKDDGFLLSCSMLGNPDMRGPAIGTQLATDLQREIDNQGQIIATPVRGADIYSLIAASNNVRIEQLGPPTLISRNQRPFARISGLPQAAEAGAALQADGSTSSDNEGPITGYAWSVEGPCSVQGAATASSLPAVVNANAAEGSVCTFRLTVRDNTELTGTANAQVRIGRTTGGNTPPVARITGLAAQVQTGGRYVVDGSQSMDAEGPIAGYSWRAGGGTRADGACTIEGNASGAVAVVAVAPNALNDSTCSVELTVRDSAGATASTSAHATVVEFRPTNQPPVGRIDGMPVRLVAGGRYNLSGTNSYDPDGTVSGYIWTVSGDCSFAAGSTSPTVTLAASTTPGQGFCAVSLKVVDNLGASGTTAVSANFNQSPVAAIKGLPPVAPLPAGGRIALSASGSYDPDGTLTAYRWIASGDCSATTPTAADTDIVVPATLPATPSCTVDLVVTDDSGATASARGNVPLLGNKPPVAVTSSVYPPPRPGTNFVVSGAGSSDSDGSIAGYAWAVSGACSAASALNTVTVTATSPVDAAPGDPCFIDLVVTDDKGGSATTRTTVYLNRPPIVAIQTGTPARGTTFSVWTSGGDPDGNVVGYQWSAGSLFPWAGYCSISGSTTGPTANVQAADPGGTVPSFTCRVGVYVTDDSGVASYTSIDIPL